MEPIPLRKMIQDFWINFVQFLPELITGLVVIIVDGIHTFEEVVRSEGKMPMAFVSNLSASAMEITVHYWVYLPGTTVSVLALKSDIIIHTLRVLKKASMHIPTSILEIKNYPPELIRKEIPDQAH